MHRRGPPIPNAGRSGDPVSMSLSETHSDPRTAPVLPTALRLGAVHLPSPTSTAPSPGTRRRSACACTPTTPTAPRWATAPRPSSSCTRTRRRGPPAATPASTTTRCCTRAARSSPARPSASRRPARRSRARPTTARTRRSTCPTPTATASSSPPTARATQWPAGLGYAGGPAPLDFDALLATVAGEEPTAHVGEGLRMGHLHLHVGDIDDGLALLPRRARLRGAGRTSAPPRSSPPAATTITSASTSGTAAASARRPTHTAGLRHWTVELPDADDVAAVRARVEAAGHRGRAASTAASSSRDPWETAVRIVHATHSHERTSP